jgi:acetyltransferase-like isoleucine patch superfamily enzyme
MNSLNSIIAKFLYKFGSPSKYAKFIGVKIGSGCSISTKLFSSEPYLISIGDNCRVASEVLLLTHGGVRPLRKIYAELIDFDYFGKVRIGNNVYIGQRSIIMPGVTIEDNCIIGAMSVVTKSIPKNSVVAGNPAKIITNTDNFVERIKKFNVKTNKLDKIARKKILLSLDDSHFMKKTFLTKKI